MCRMGIAQLRRVVSAVIAGNLGFSLTLAQVDSGLFKKTVVCEDSHLVQHNPQLREPGGTILVASASKDLKPL